ncbi:MAG: DUF4251 domain-containing protein [Bacteroidales bacterium]
MKSLTVGIALLLFSITLQAQYYEAIDSVPKRVKKSKLEKEEQTAKDYQLMESILESKRFVLEATYLSNSRGTRIPVNSGINFIMADSTRGVIQVGNDAGIGSNGLGGTTVEGSIMRWELKKDTRRKNFTASWTVMSAVGTYDVIMYVSPGGYASCRVSGNWSGSITFDGNLVHKSRSRVFKGRSY